MRSLKIDDPIVYFHSPMDADAYARSLARPMQRALRQFRAAATTGARQVGKSTLVQTMAGRHFVTLDDLGALSAGEADPRAFIRSRARPRRLGRYRTAVARRPRSHLHRRTARPLLAQHPQAAGQVAEA